MNYLQTELVFLFLPHVDKLATFCVFLFWLLYSYSGLVGIMAVALSALPFHGIWNFWRYKSHVSPEAQTRALQILTQDHALQEVLMVIEPSLKLFLTRVIAKLMSLRDHANEIRADLTKRNSSGMVNIWKTFAIEGAARDIVIAHTLLIIVALLSPLLILPLLWILVIFAINFVDWGAEALSTTYILTSHGIAVFVDHEHEQTMPWRILQLEYMVANENMGWVSINQHYYIPSDNPGHLLKIMKNIRSNHIGHKKDVEEILDM